jgi:hypothetical protein
MQCLFLAVDVSRTFGNLVAPGWCGGPAAMASPRELSALSFSTPQRLFRQITSFNLLVVHQYEVCLDRQMSLLYVTSLPHHTGHSGGTSIHLLQTIFHI